MANYKEVNLTETLENSFANYAGMVIQDRAIIDVRDGLKPSARQLTYAQYIDKLTSDKPFKKATKSVAAGMAHFYVHGDASAYSTLIRMGKPFAMRYPLEEVQGSYGNQMENDNEAASRYVEMRLSPLGTHLFTSIEKNTIDENDWRENYDGTEKYPAVLPSIGFYNLIQGSTGIGVALASSIPQFNLREMNEALIKLLWDKDVSFEELNLMPDFATGATIINGDEIKESLKNGIGPAIKIRAKLENDYENNQIIVTELPYGVYTNTICQQLTKAIEENPDCGIVKFLDLTGLTPLIKITLTKGVNFGKVKDFLYKHTSLQSYFSVNMVMLKDGKVPQIFGLKEAMLEYLEHSKKVLERQIKFDLAKAQARLEIVEGYLKALSIIDEIVALIKAQTNSAAACAALMSVYNFSERQAKAILDLKLNRLVNMEIAKIQEEKESLEKNIAYYNLLLTNKHEFLSVIENDLKKIAQLYGDDRRTIITNISEEAPIVEETVIIVYISTSGAIVAKKMDEVNTQQRRTVGDKIKFANKNDGIWKTIVGKTTEQILVFTNLGKSYSLKLSNIPLNEEIYINQLLDLKMNEHIINTLSFDSAKKCQYVIFATKNGIVKKTKMSEYLNSTRKTGLIALKIREDDALISTQMIVNNNDKVLLATKNGKYLLLKQDDFPATARQTIGIKGIKIEEDNELVDMIVINNSINEIITITSKGYGKRTLTNEFDLGNRATKGLKICEFKEEDDYLAAVVGVTSQTKTLLINTKLSSLRIMKDSLALQNKDTMGVQTIKLSDKNNVQNVIVLEN